MFLEYVKDQTQSEEASCPAKELEMVFRLHGGMYRISKYSALSQSFSLRGVS